MAVITSDQFEEYSKGGGQFFTLKDGESANVRFLYNNYTDLRAHSVHDFVNPGNSATIDCARQQGDPVDTCKWCASGYKPVPRIILAMFNEDTQSIQYWKKSLSWVQNTLKPYFDEIAPGQPISGQIYKIKRTGKDLNTIYTPIPVGANDNKTCDQFGEVKDAFELNIIKPNNYDYNPNMSTNTNNTTQIPTATRRTMDMF